MYFLLEELNVFNDLFFALEVEGEGAYPYSDCISRNEISCVLGQWSDGVPITAPSASFFSSVRSQEVGMCLGAQAGEKKMRGVVNSAGFSRFRRATQTPFNLVYEARR
jgi:hypothetical protein